MRVRVNGEAREVPETLSVAGLLALLGLRREGLVVERNGQVLRNEEHASVLLGSEDRLEIVRFVGGG